MTEDFLTSTLRRAGIEPPPYPDDEPLSGPQSDSGDDGRGVGADDPAPWPSLAPAALHGLAGDIVLRLEPDTEADPAGMLVDLLVATGCAIGAGPHARVGGAVHPPRLNAVKVGRTSRGRKGQGWADVRQALDHADPLFAERIMGGLASGEGLIAAVSDPDDDDQGDSRDRRLLVVEPEYARVLNVAGRDGSTLSAVLRDAWDSGNMRVLTRKHPLTATGAHICVLGHVTVEELRRRLSEVEVANGFANRFLFVCVTRSKLLPSGPTIDPQTVAELGGALRDALLEARKIGHVGRTAGAEELWADLYHRMADADAEGLVGAVTARAEAQVLRLSLIYALLDGARRIDVAHLEAAWAIWSYCEASARFIFGDSLGDEVADRLLAAIRAEPDGLDTTAQSALFGRHVSAARREVAAQALIDRGLARSVRIDTGGRPRTVLLAAAQKAQQAQEAPS